MIEEIHNFYQIDLQQSYLFVIEVRQTAIILVKIVDANWRENALMLLVLRLIYIVIFALTRYWSPKLPVTSEIQQYHLKLVLL